MLVMLDDALGIAEEHLRWELDAGRTAGRSATNIFNELLQVFGDDDLRPTWPNAIDALITAWCYAKLGG